MAPSDSTKDALIAAARQVFAEKGYEGATVKDIAERAGANISLVSYHFQGKENLFRTCVQEFGEARLAAVERVLKPAESITDFRVRITLFIEELYSEAQKDPEMHSIMLRDCGNLNNPIIQEVFQGTFMKLFQHLITFFENGQQKKFLSADFKAHEVCLFFIGGILHTIRMDAVHQKLYGKSFTTDAVYRENLVKTAVKLLMEGIVP